MACYHPLKAFSVGLHPSGKTKYKIRGQDTVFVTSDDGIPVYEHTPIPCGKCIGCRLEYSRQWANRCMLELDYHKSSYFVTLTYDDLHLPDNDIVNIETGEIVQSPVHTLVKRDLQLFMKRLRKNTGQEIRYFACGEYGDETHRPHYHLIIFGLELTDLKIYKQNFRGELYYNSPTLSKCWNKGFAVVADVTWDTCAYVARYVTKKLTGKKSDIYADFNLQPPFVLMSRKPGIAKQYFDDNFDKIYRYDRINLSLPSGGKSFKPPKYYDRLYDIDFPDDMKSIKESRQFVASELQQRKIDEMGLPLDEILYIEEDNLLRKLGHIKERNCI